MCALHLASALGARGGSARLLRRSLRPANAASTNAVSVWCTRRRCSTTPAATGTAAAAAPRAVVGVIIGDEVLTGKVEDANSGILARLCFQWGCTLQRVEVVRDDRAAIADAVHRARRDVRAAEEGDAPAGAPLGGIVVTTGGIGPTHDDITVSCRCQR